MKKKDKKLLFVASFEDASILRKFTILFLVASVVPLILIFYIYTEHNAEGGLDISDYSFTVVMVLLVLGIFVGYSAMRELLKKVIDITKENKKALEGFLSPETLAELNKDQNEIVILSRSFSMVTKQLEENIKSLEVAKRTLHSVMAKVGQGISNMENIDTFLQLILETMTSALNGKVATLLLFTDKKTDLIIHTVYGANINLAQTHLIKLFDGMPLSRIIETKRPEIISGVFLKNFNSNQYNELFSESLLCAPLIYKDKVNGIITLSKANDNDMFTEEDKTLLFNLASQTAIALENSKLDKDIEKTYFETISALALAVDAKDKYSRGHLDRVAEYAIMIGKHLGLDEEDLDILRDGARLHDVGKIGIPDEILRKDGSLTDEEWVIMRRHPEIGESILKPVRSLNPLCDLVRHHHERLDGTGYPDRLKGDEITPLVRILAVVDVYDALITERSYRAKKTQGEAFEIIRSMKNHLDQDLVEVLIECLKAKEI